MEERLLVPQVKAGAIELVCKVESLAQYEDRQANWLADWGPKQQFQGSKDMIAQARREETIFMSFK